MTSLEQAASELVSHLPPDCGMCTADDLDALTGMLSQVGAKRLDVAAMLRNHAMLRNRPGADAWAVAALDVDRAEWVLWKWQKDSGWFDFLRTQGEDVDDREPAPTCIQEPDGRISVRIRTV
jgi:hypothetical protein